MSAAPFDPSSSYMPDSGSPAQDVMAPPDQQPAAQPPQDVVSNVQTPQAPGPDPDAGSSTHGWRAVLKGALSGLESHLAATGKGALMGGIPGAITGAISPKTVDTTWEQQQQLRQANVQQHQAAARSAVESTNYQAQNNAVQLATAQTHLAALNAQFNSMPKDFADKILQEGAEANAQMQRSGLQPVFSGDEEDARAHLQARMQVNTDNPLGVTMLPNSSGGFDVFEINDPNKTFDHTVDITIGHNADGTAITKQYFPGQISVARALNLETAAMLDESKNQAKIAQQQTKNAGAANVAEIRNAGKANGPAKVDNFLVGADADGNQIAGTKEELAASGVKNVSKLPAADASKVVAARELVSPDGLFSLIASDMKALGPNGLNAVGSRFNEFMSGKVGAGDDNYTRLRTHVRLLSSALMQAHVGSRGSEAMLEEFRGLADQGKMNSQTLKSALAGEYDYVHGRALLPRQKAAQ